MNKSSCKLTALNRSSKAYKKERPLISASSAWKSHTVLDSPGKLKDVCCNKLASGSKSSCGEYYKRYEHDDILLKDRFSCQLDSESGIGDERTISDVELLDDDSFKAEVFHSMPKNFEPSSRRTLDYQNKLNCSTHDTLDAYNKFSKCNTKQIPNTHTSMNEFKLYKENFQEIIDATKTESVGEMKQFIKNITHDIISSIGTPPDQKDGSQHTFVVSSSDERLDENLRSQDPVFTDNCVYISPTSETTNELTTEKDDVTDTKDASKDRATRNSEIFNIYILNANPCLEIKMNDRHMLSEINIRNDNCSKLSPVASAENSKKLAAKLKEMETYVKQIDVCKSSDRNIPVKISSAKNNFLLEHQLVSKHDENRDKSLFAKIWNFVIKKLRRS